MNIQLLLNSPELKNYFGGKLCIFVFEIPDISDENAKEEFRKIERIIFTTFIVNLCLIKETLVIPKGAYDVFSQCSRIISKVFQVMHLNISCLRSIFLSYEFLF